MKKQRTCKLLITTLFWLLPSSTVPLVLGLWRKARPQRPAAQALDLEEPRSPRVSPRSGPTLRQSVGMKFPTSGNIPTDIMFPIITESPIRHPGLHPQYSWFHSTWLLKNPITAAAAVALQSSSSSSLSSPSLYRSYLHVCCWWHVQILTQTACFLNARVVAASKRLSCNDLQRNHTHTHKTCEISNNGSSKQNLEFDQREHGIYTVYHIVELCMHIIYNALV